VEDWSGLRGGQKALKFSNPSDEIRAASPCYEIPLSRVRFPSASNTGPRFFRGFVILWGRVVHPLCSSRPGSGDASATRRRPRKTSRAVARGHLDRDGDAHAGCQNVEPDIG
jgi:hypothetical protein